MIIWLKYFKSFTLFIGTLLDISSTDKAPAKDPTNNAITFLNFIFNRIEIIDNIASPAPILSTADFAKASDKINLLF